MLSEPSLVLVMKLAALRLCYLHLSVQPEEMAVLPEEVVCTFKQSSV